MLYKLVKPLNDGDVVNFVGYYVTRWQKEPEPTVGFREATYEEIVEELGHQLDSEDVVLLP